MQFAPALESRFAGPLNILLWIFILSMLVYLALIRVMTFGGLGANVLVVALSFGMLQIAGLMRRESRVNRAFSILLVALLLMSSVYFYRERLDILSRIPLNNVDYLMAGMIVATALSTVRRTFGWLFPIITIAAVVYAFVAPDLPHPFKSSPYTPLILLDKLSTHIYVGLVSLQWQFLWLLLFWGMLLNTAGFGKLVITVGTVLAKRFRGGPAYMSVVTSAMAGSFTGAGPSNCAITGPITIPLMKRAGYRSDQAAAIEALASNIAGLTPPILGTVAFLMVEFLQVSYGRIMLISLIPAGMWFATVGAFIYAHARRHEGQLVFTTLETEEVLSKNQIVRATILGGIPFAILVVLAGRGWNLFQITPYAFISLVVLALILRVETRWSVWSQGIKNAAVLASLVTGVLILLQILQEALHASGLTVKLGDVIWALSGGSIVTAAIVMLVAGVFLGSALPAVAVYGIMLVTFVPVMNRFGVPPVASHFVAFYMGLLGSIVPPVAASAVITAAIGGTTYWKVCSQIVRMALPVMIAPIALVMAPELLLEGDVGTARTLISIAAFVIGSASVSFATAGWLVRSLPMPPRVLLAGAYVPMLAGLYLQQPAWLFLALAIPVGVAIWARLAPSLSNPPQPDVAT